MKIRIVINKKTFSLARGKVARIYYSEKSPCGREKPLRFWKKVAGKEKTSWHRLDELDRINQAAEEMNRSATIHGFRFAIPSRDEMVAVWKFREFAKRRRRAGEEFPPLSEIVSAALAREEERDVTPKYSEAVAEYISDKRSSNRSGKAHIEAVERILLRVGRELEEKTLGEVTISDVEGIIARAKFSPNTRRHYIATIRGLFSWWYSRANATRRPIDRIINPLELLEIPVVKKTEDPEIITPAQLKKHLEEVRAKRPQLLPATVIQAFCGARRAEALRVKWKDIRDGFVYFSCAITKTRISRTAPLPACAVEWLKPYTRRHPESFIAYPTVRGENRELRINNTTLQDSSTRLPKNALRHSAATYLSQIYGNAKAADFCGHDPRTAGVYYRAASTPEVAKKWFNVYPS